MPTKRNNDEERSARIDRLVADNQRKPRKERESAKGGSSERVTTFAGTTWQEAQLITMVGPGSESRVGRPDGAAGT